MPDEAPGIEAHGLTDTGPVRQDNQDAIRFCHPDDGLAARHGHLYGIADGMGGFSHGGIASALALEVLFKTFYAHQGTPRERLRQSVQDANLGIYQMAARMGAGRMGTTLTAVHLAGHTLHVAHVGDSRAYLVRDGVATLLTQDHTRVGELVRLRLLSPDKVRSHQQRSVLDKCLGLELFVQPDIFAVPVRPGDRIVLCTDGVWGFVEDQDLADLAAGHSTLEGFNQAVLDAAMLRGSDDNLSLLSLHFRSLTGAPEPSPVKSWFGRLFKR
jgi:protein phosphatase